MTTTLRSIFLFLALSIVCSNPGTTLAVDYSDQFHWKSGEIFDLYITAGIEEGDWLYLAEGCPFDQSCAGALRIYDSSSGDPVLTGEVAFGHAIREVEVSGDVAYLASGGDGLVVVDISDRTAPTVLFSGSTTDAQDVRLDGSILYLLTATELRTYDVSFPGVPVLLDTSPYGGTGVALGLGHAYLMPSLTILDVSNPSEVAVVVEGELPNPEARNDGQAEVVGTTLYTSSNLQGDQGRELEFRSWSLSDPAQPLLVDRIVDRSGSGIEPIRLVLASGQIVFNWKPSESDGINDGLTIISDSNGFDAAGIWNGEFTALVPSNGMELLAFGNGEVHRFEIGSGHGALLVGEASAGLSAGSILAMDDLILLADNSAAYDPHALRIVNVSDPSAPQLLGEFFGTPDGAYGGLTRASDDRVVLSQTSDFGGRLDIVDIATPTQPFVVGSLSFEFLSLGSVLVRGDYGFMSTWDPVEAEYLIRPFDLTDPLNPTLTGNDIEIDRTGTLLSLGTDILHVSRGVLAVFEETFPGELTLISSLDLSSYTLGNAELVGNQLHILAKDTHNYLLTVDLSDRFSPTLVGTLFLLAAGDLCVDGAILIVGGKDYFYAAEPGSPLPIPGFRDDRRADRCAAVDGHVYVTSKGFTPNGSWNELFVYELPSFDTADAPIEDSPLGTLPSIQVFPNPATGSQTLTLWGIDSRVDSKIEIVDVRGRLVRSMPVTGENGSGIARWDGTDSRRQAVASGLYWARVRSHGSVVRTTALLRIR